MWYRQVQGRIITNLRGVIALCFIYTDALGYVIAFDSYDAKYRTRDLFIRPWLRHCRLLFLVISSRPMSRIAPIRSSYEPFQYWRPLTNVKGGSTSFPPQRQLLNTRDVDPSRHRPRNTKALEVESLSTLNPMSTFSSGLRQDWLPSRHGPRPVNTAPARSAHPGSVIERYTQSSFKRSVALVAMHMRSRQPGVAQHHKHEKRGLRSISPFLSPYLLAN